MLYESPHVWVDSDDGVATLWLAFPGEPTNALSPTRLAEIARALDAVLPRVDFDALVVRSARPDGFCAGYEPDWLAGLATDADLAGAARFGQAVLNRLAAAEMLTVALIEGPCVGPGLELALACDYRLAVAGPDSWLGFPDAAHGVLPCWGGSVRAAKLLDGSLRTAREAHRAGVVTDAFSARRTKIELALFLDKVRAKPRKPRRRGETPDAFARERAAFLRTASGGRQPPVPLPSRNEDRGLTPPARQDVAVVGESLPLAELAVEAALRNNRAYVLSAALVLPIESYFAEALRRGRATPLELDQARKRVHYSSTDVGSARWLVADRAGIPAILALEPQLPPACVVAVPADALDAVRRQALRPQRIVDTNSLGGVGSTLGAGMLYSSTPHSPKRPGHETWTSTATKKRPGSETISSPTIRRSRPGSRATSPTPSPL